MLSKKDRQEAKRKNDARIKLIQQEKEQARREQYLKDVYNITEERKTDKDKLNQNDIINLAESF